METQKNSLATISPAQTSEQPVSSSEAIRQFLVKAGEVYCKQITAPLVSIWVDELSGYSPDVLEPIFRNALRTSKFFPTLADVLEPLKAVEQSGFEDEWQALLDYCREWVHPDIQFSGRPQLPVEIDHAARAAGGVYFLRECSKEELGWRKKSFIEDLTRSRKTGDLAGLITGGELRKLLRQAAAPVGLLPNSVPYTPAIAADRESMKFATEGFANLPAPIQADPQVIDFEGRARELQRQAELIRQKYPTTEKEAVR